MAIYKVTFSNGDIAYVSAASAVDALAEGEYQFGPEPIDAVYSRDGFRRIQSRNLGQAPNVVPDRQS